MILIGERINSSRKAIKEAVEKRDEAFLKREMADQAAAGIQMIDLNVGTFVEDEPRLMSWLVELANDTVSIPLCIDSPSEVTIRKAVKKSSLPVVINSITAETERLKSHLPIIEKHKAPVIGLCMDDRGVPATPEERCQVGLGLLETLMERGLAREDIYIDPIVQPIACGPEGVRTCLETIRLLRVQSPEIHIICGLRNVSHGLPKRSLIDEAFLSMAIYMGMDTVILNPLDKRLMAILRAAEALAGDDEHCMAYLSAYRKGDLECQ